MENALAYQLNEEGWSLNRLSAETAIPYSTLRRHVATGDLTVKEIAAISKATGIAKSTIYRLSDSHAAA